jgi:DNA repair exonuclease SbcCD ATPase subunit
MNQFKNVLLAAGCMLAVGTTQAFPFIHSSGLMAELLLEDQPVVDTVPGSLDDHLKSLDKAEKSLTLELSSKNWESIEKSMQEALAKINSGEIERELAKAMKELEASKKVLAEQLNSAFSKEEMAAQLKELDKALAQQKLDQGRMKEELKAERESIKAELKKTLPNMEKELKNAKAEIAKVRVLLTGYKEMISKMKADGLIKDEANYRIEYSGDALIIDGNKQSDATLNKYRSYFPDKNTVIENKNNRFDIKKD